MNRNQKIAALVFLLLMRRRRLVPRKKKFRRKKGQKAKEDALRKTKDQDIDENELRTSNKLHPPSKKRRLNESEDETSSSDSDDSSMTESDDSSLFSQTSDSESNSESDISSLSEDTFCNYDKNDENIAQVDFDENEINEALAVKPEPYDDPLATINNLNDKPFVEGEEDIKPNIIELEEALEIHNTNKEENCSIQDITQVIRVKEEPNS